MKITVCVKQVPDTADIKWTENNTLDREGVASVVNPCDYSALETALRIKDKTETEITAVSMGPLQAEKVLKEAIALGVDKTLLLSDKCFAGSDTAATARVLSAAIKNKIKEYDLILCGQYATDGDTAQTGPALAQNLNISIATNVLKIQKLTEKSLIALKKTEEGTERIEVLLPAVICILSGGYEVRLPKISGRMKANGYTVPVLKADDIGISSDETGIKGSPTYVKRAFRPTPRSVCEIIQGKTSSEAADFIIEEINKTRL